MASESRKLNVGVIGCGHWGPNHVRVFSEHERAVVGACADTNESRLAAVRQRFPRLTTTTDYQRLLEMPEIDAVIIATPTGTHHTLTREALKAGKHVLVEKPMSHTLEQALELVNLADESGKVLMVGHIFLFNAGIRHLRESIASRELGRIHYLDAIRTNLGPVRGDVNALYDLGTHDITIFNYLLDAQPVAVSALGRCISQKNIEDVCFATLRYPDGTLGHIHVSWMNPRKVRTVTIIGERKMATWDDIDPADMLRLYDKGLGELPYYDSFGEFHYLLRNADVHIPAVRRTEPLVAQADAFVRWVLDGQASMCDARQGLAVARVLEAAALSMKNGGAMCPIALDDGATYTSASRRIQDVTLMEQSEALIGTRGG